MDVLTQSVDELHVHGLDIVEPLCLSWYNEAAPSYAVCDQRANALALIVGNSGAIWEPFLMWLRQRLFPTPDAPDSVNANGFSLNPLDDYATSGMQKALKATSASAEVYWGYDLRPERMVALQKAAQCTGAFAHDGQHSHLCFHETLGSWCSLRAMVVFRSIDGPQSAPTLRAQLPNETALLELAELMRKALNVQSTTSPMDQLTPAAADAWVDFRVTAGRSHAHAAFEPCHLRYTVTKDRRLLLSALAERWPEHKKACEQMISDIDAHNV